MEIIPCTLCFILEDTRVLLGMKKRGFGAGKWNGYGGKIHGGESVEEAARREVFEESGLVVTALEPAGRIAFRYPLQTHDVAVFRARSYTGTLAETDEMRSAWHPIERLPVAAMWIDDPYWLPACLRGAYITAEFVFDGDERLRAHRVKAI